MKRLMLVVFVAAAALMLPPRAAAQPAHPDSPKATLPVFEEVLVGTTVLSPGEYRVQCRTIEGKTFLVITSQENGKEIVRVPCAAQMLDAKIPVSEFLTVRNASGRRILTSVRIKGEMSEHRVVIN